jgi:hypothetical protein
MPAGALSEDDVIGNYAGEDDGTGHTQNKLEDDLDESQFHIGATCE